MINFKENIYKSISTFEKDFKTNESFLNKIKIFLTQQLSQQEKKLEFFLL